MHDGSHALLHLKLLMFQISRFVLPFFHLPIKLRRVQYHSLRRKKFIRISSQSQVQTRSTVLEPTSNHSNSTNVKCQWLVIVESPVKAKTIQNYLGEEYEVIASNGHVRDLASKSGSVQPENDFEVQWQLNARSDQIIKAFISSLKSKKGLILATDPDREGEAISWHVVETLREKSSLPPNLQIQRVCFNEITKNAIIKAIQSPRDVSSSLVEAYLARRALDYLIGFHLSPILWKRLPGSKSAGRVQSVALKLICERESEMERFVPDEYWTINTSFSTEKGESFDSVLTFVDGKRFDRFSIKNESMAKEIVHRIQQSNFIVRKVKESKFNRSPFPPFSTSTLQQEASNRLGFSVSKTMALSQRLYEGVNVNGQSIGIITYMRTDSIQLSSESVRELRNVAQQRYGTNLISETPRVYKTKIKNTQEAHEAIRPTNPRLHPSDLKNFLEKDEIKLYALIWYRSISSQMSNAIFHQVSVDIESESKDLCFHSSGSELEFEGYLAAKKDVSHFIFSNYSNESEVEEPESNRLPTLIIGQNLERKGVNFSQHFTSPPPRYSEGSLVKQMEEFGIGRPSTYATIIKTLQMRRYINIQSRRIFPELRGRLVTLFLEKYFPRYMDYYFTAKVESQLDEISSGEIYWKTIMVDFWKDFIQNLNDVEKVDISQLSAFYNEEIGEKLIFPKLAQDLSDNMNLCPTCKIGKLEIKLSSHGSGIFLGCGNYPDCKYILNIDSKLSFAEKKERSLGIDEKTGNEIYIKRGPYGSYIESLNKDAKKKKPLRAKLPEDWNFDEIHIEDAIKLFNPARIIGTHPDGDVIEIVPFARFGPYLIHNNFTASIPKNLSVDDVDLNIAVEILEKKRNKLKINEEKKLLKNSNAVKEKKSKTNKKLKDENDMEVLNTTSGENGEKQSIVLADEGKRNKKKPSINKIIPTNPENIEKGESKGEEDEGSVIVQISLDESLQANNIPRSLGSTQGKKNIESVQRPSEKLADFLGISTLVSRKEVYSMIWNYIKENDLQHPNDKKRANLDVKLENLLGVKEVTTLSLNSLIRKHLTTPDS